MFHLAWKLKKEWEGKSIDNINIPLDDLTQKQISRLNESVRNSLFIEDKPKKDDLSYEEIFPRISTKDEYFNNYKILIPALDKY